MAIKSKRVKVSAKQRRKYRIRKKVSGTDQSPRLTVFKSSKHIYVQAVSDQSGKTLASASTRESAVADRVSSVKLEGHGADHTSTKCVRAARTVGLVLGERLQEQKIGSVVFDRNGNRYQGRVQAVAEGVRESGLNF